MSSMQTSQSNSPVPDEQFWEFTDDQSNFGVMRPREVVDKSPARTYQYFRSRDHHGDSFELTQYPGQQFNYLQLIMYRTINDEMTFHLATRLMVIPTTKLGDKDEMSEFLNRLVDFCAESIVSNTVTEDHGVGIVKEGDQEENNRPLTVLDMNRNVLVDRLRRGVNVEKIDESDEDWLPLSDSC